MRATKFGERIHIDFCDAGPYEAIHCLVILDEATGQIAASCFPDRCADTVCSALLAFAGSAKAILELYSDNALEFISAAEILKIKHNQGQKYRPQSDALIERTGQTIQTLARCLLFQSGLPLSFSSYALSCAALVMSTIVHGKQEQNAWFARNGKEFPGLVRPFGSEVVVKMPVEIDGRSKLDCTGSRALYLGPHLQAGHVFRGQYNVVLLNALADPELKVARAVHVMVNVSCPSAAVFPAFEAKQKLQSDAIASSLIGKKV